MPENYTVTITNLRCQKLVEVLGTNTVPISPPIPVSSPNGGGAFLIHLDMLSDNQLKRLIRHISNTESLPIQDIEERINSYDLAIPAEDCIMRHITQYQVDLMSEMFRQNAFEVYGGKIKVDAVSEVMWLSIMISTLMLGKDWVDQNITTNLFSGDKTPKRIDYLRPRPETERERYEHQSRMSLFADSLFLLQNCEGFDLKIEELQRVSPENPEVWFEDIFVELQIASMLVRNGHEVKFQSRSGIKSQDFDIEIKVGDNKSIFAEIECKREKTLVKTNSLRRTLYKAEKQLPTNNPSVVFVRIPTDWVEYENLAQEVDRVLRNFFRNVVHINAVVLIWEEWIRLPGNLKASVLKYRPYLHPTPQHDLGDFDIDNELMTPQNFQILPTSSFIKLSFGTFGD